MNKINVVEIFRSIQGEGANVGTDATFIRLTGCNCNCSFCDTDYDKRTEYTVEALLKKVKKLGSKNIIWTGGEPTLQLTEEILDYFADYYNCI